MSGAKVEVDVFWDPVNQANMQTEIEKLSNGIVDKKAEDAIENRTSSPRRNEQTYLPITAANPLSRLSVSPSQFVNGRQTRSNQVPL